MAEYQIAVAKGEMALTTIVVNVTACAQWQDRDDDYLNIYWRGDIVKSCVSETGASLLK